MDLPLADPPGRPPDRRGGAPRPLRRGGLPARARSQGGPGRTARRPHPRLVGGERAGTPRNRVGGAGGGGRDAAGRPSRTPPGDGSPQRPPAAGTPGRGVGSPRLPGRRPAHGRRGCRRPDHRLDGRRGVPSHQPGAQRREAPPPAGSPSIAGGRPRDAPRGRPPPPRRRRRRRRPAGGPALPAGGAG